jgi:hypothetical protein
MAPNFIYNDLRDDMNPLSQLAADSAHRHAVKPDYFV